MPYPLIVGMDNHGHLIREAIPPATEDEVTAFESMLGVRLPEDYREFLKTVNGGMVDETDCEMAVFSGKRLAAPCTEEWGFSNLYTLNEAFKNEMAPPMTSSNGLPRDNERSFLRHWARLWLKKEWMGPDADFYYTCVPTDLFPIGSAGPGDILMGVSGDRRGKIYVWRPMDDPWNEEAFDDPSKLLDPYQYIYAVASSFNEFLSSSLRPLEEG